MPTARPIAATLAMEMVEPDVAANDPETGGSTDYSSPLQRRRTVEAVSVYGGLVAGSLSRRERCRRFVNSLGWQSCQLFACLTALAMLLAEVGGASLAVVNAVTAFVLATFVIDLAVRMYVYRRMLLRSLPFWFDFIVISVSLILYLVGVIAEAHAHVTSSRGVGASLRSLIVALRWLRAARTVAALVRTTSSSTSAARHITGENKRRFVDLVSASSATARAPEPDAR